MGHTAARLFDAHEDVQEMMRNLARQGEAIRSGAIPGVVHQEPAMTDSTPTQSENAETESGPARPENVASMVLDVEDLKTKTAHLIERVDQLTRGADHFAPLHNKVEQIEALLERWATYLPSIGWAEEMENIHSNIELQDELRQLKEGDRNKMMQLRNAIDEV